MNTSPLPEGALTLSNDDIYRALREIPGDFAASLSRTMISGRYGLSEKQDYWARKLAFEFLNPDARPARTGEQLGEGFARVVGLFETAKANGLKRPALTFAGVGGCDKIKIYPAGATSKNFGSLYVKGNGIYLGKISSTGEFFASRDCTDGAKSWLREMAENPVSVAAMNGRQTGNCCFCARELTDHRSVEVGYGPICSERFGLPWGE